MGEVAKRLGRGQIAEEHAKRKRRKTRWKTVSYREVIGQISLKGWNLSRRVYCEEISENKGNGGERRKIGVIHGVCAMKIVIRRLSMKNVPRRF